MLTKPSIVLHWSGQATTSAVSTAELGHLISLIRFFRTYFQRTWDSGSGQAGQEIR
jgi:hypothetical protein